MRHIVAGLILQVVLAGGTTLAQGTDAGDNERDDASKPQTLVNKPDPGRQRLSDSEIGRQLDQLFQWTGSRKYYYYFFMMPKHLEITQLYATSKDLMIDKVRLVHPYDNGQIEQDNHRGPAITLTCPSSLQDIPSHNGICVKLDGIGEPVPAKAAEVVASGFSEGFVTRMVLGEYVKAWNAKGAQISLDDLNFASGVSPQFQNGTLIKDFVNPSAYIVPNKPPSDEDFDKGLDNLLRTHNLRAIGLLYGWKAASELEPMRDGGNDDKIYYDAAMRLLRARFSTQEAGEITGYTLHYLLGYARIANLRLKATPNPEPAAQNNDQILTRLASDKDVEAAKEFLHMFGDVLLDETFAIVTSEGIDSASKGELVPHYMAFVKGYNYGSIRATDDAVMFAYQDGYTDGYSRGYADGYRDGYAIGHKEAWAEANKVIAQLRSELARRNSIGGFLKDIGEGAVMGLGKLIGLGN